MADYYATYQNYLCGRISQQEWKDFCFSVLCQLMEDNSDVLVRLKNV